MILQMEYQLLYITVTVLNKYAFGILKVCICFSKDFTAKDSLQYLKNISKNMNIMNIIFPPELSTTETILKFK